MYQEILVALDGSKLSEAVLPYARFFAKSLKLPVELLRVIGPETLAPLSAELLALFSGASFLKTQGLCMPRKRNLESLFLGHY